LLGDTEIWRCTVTLAISSWFFGSTFSRGPPPPPAPPPPRPPPPQHYAACLKTRYISFLPKYIPYRQCTYERSIETRSRNHCCRGKAISITYSECVSVALVFQRAKRVRRIIVMSVASMAAYFSTLSHKRYDFRRGGGGGITENKMCVLIFSTTFVWNISHSENSARYYKCTLVFT
jgi:hypothetical protein